METHRLSVVFPHTRVASLVKILRTTAHGAFPVVSPMGSEGESESLLSFENQKVSLNDDDDDDDGGGGGGGDGDGGGSGGELE